MMTTEKIEKQLMLLLEAASKNADSRLDADVIWWCEKIAGTLKLEMAKQEYLHKRDVALQEYLNVRLSVQAPATFTPATNSA